MSLIFLSHSSNDAQFVKLLSEQIELAFSPEVKVFASSRPGAIPSGTDWRDKVMEQLEKADVLVILTTIPAENSVWVGFEFGYFWKKTDKERIHILRHPTAKLPSPLDIIQHKRITEMEELNDFFQELGKSLGQDYTGKAELKRVVSEANLLSVAPPERSLRNFERLIERSEWDKFTFEEQEVWVCTDDALFQVVIDYGSPEVDDKFRNSWTRRFPDAESSTKYPVKLNIGSAVIYRLFFISVDGGRYFVPIPQIKDVDENGIQILLWKQNSIYFKLAKLIGEFYRSYPTIEEFAKYCNIQIE